MPTRSDAQIIGTKGERLVQGIFDEHERWIARQQTHDFGIDLEAELAEPSSTGQHIKGKLLKLQVKAHQTVKRKANHISVQIERSLLDYADAFRLPVILTVVCLDTHTVWWMWLQEWTLNNEARLAGKPYTETIAIRIPINKTLNQGLNADLPAIAAGTTQSAMILALRNIIEAASGWENHEIADGVVRILGKVHGESRAWILQKVTDKLLGLGSDPAFWKAQQYLPVLLPLIEASGDTFTAEQVLRLVGRGDSYSRTGLFGLSRLYDLWRKEMIALNLTHTFEAAGLGQAAWYAAMRERYPTEEHQWFGFYLAQIKETNLDFGEYRLTLNDEVRNYIMRKWPNRGDSVLLDCLSLIPESELQSKSKI